MPDDNADNVMARVPSGATAKAPTSRFTGDVWVDWITDGAQADSARLAAVRFSPGARSAWHRHALGQTLHVTAGIGLVQSRDGHVMLMRQGDTVYTPPSVWHWHGAVSDTFMVHLALADSCGRPDEPDVEWGEQVTEQEYLAAHRAVEDKS